MSNEYIDRHGRTIMRTLNGELYILHDEHQREEQRWAKHRGELYASIEKFKKEIERLRAENELLPSLIWDSDGVDITMFPPEHVARAFGVGFLALLDSFKASNFVELEFVEALKGQFSVDGRKVLVTAQLSTGKPPGAMYQEAKEEIEKLEAGINSLLAENAKLRAKLTDESGE